MMMAFFPSQQTNRWGSPVMVRRCAVVMLTVFSFCGGSVLSAQEETNPVAGTSTAAQSRPDTEASGDAVGADEASLGTERFADPADRSRIVYVSDFEVDLANAKDAKGAPIPVTSLAPATSATSPAPAAPATASVGAGSATQPESKEEKREEIAAERASEFVDFLSTTLVAELERAGYVARRLHPGEARPDEGLRISGVFAEPDEENRLRRAVLDGGPNVGQMALFVSIGNLARPDQVLYTVVDPKTATANVGPVITVSAYAPVARFALPKNVTEKAVRDTVTSIVADLSLLLNQNVAALTH
jgi:hypothetical protein